MNHYKHFTLKEREMIKHYIDIGKNQSEIALLLKRNKSSISRELIRNNINGEYLPCDVQSSYLKRRLCCKPKKKLDNQIVYKCVKIYFPTINGLRSKFLKDWKLRALGTRLAIILYIEASMTVYLMNPVYLTEIEVLYVN